MLGIRAWRIERRSIATPTSRLVASGTAILLGFAFASLLIRFAGADLGGAYSAMFRGSFGTKAAFLETLVKATPLIFTGLAATLAFRAKIWNIGLEGQLIAGAMMTYLTAATFPEAPRAVQLILILLLAAVAGALWGAIPAALKIRLGVSEVISTVLLNYVMTYALSFMLTGAWRDPSSFFLQTRTLGPNAQLPTVSVDGRLHWGLFLALALCMVAYIWLFMTPKGFEIRAMGHNPRAARYKGIAVAANVLIVFAISGGLGGLAGASELSGLLHRLRTDISVGYGYAGIIVALLGGLNPLGAILAALCFGALVNGCSLLQIETGVPTALVYAIQGVVLLCWLSANALASYRIRSSRDG